MTQDQKAVISDVEQKLQAVRNLQVNEVMKKNTATQINLKNAAVIDFNQFLKKIEKAKNGGEAKDLTKLNEKVTKLTEQLAEAQKKLDEAKGEDTPDAEVQKIIDFAEGLNGEALTEEEVKASHELYKALITK